MSTAGISSSSLVQGAQYFQDRKSDLQQLGQALQSGDLTGAQQDFSTIQNLAQNGPFAGGNAFAVNQRQQDFTAIGQALQSGDIAGAQQAFAQLQSTFKSGHAVLDPGPSVIINISEPAAGGTSSSASSTPTGAVTATPTASGAIGPEIAINFANNSGSSANPEEITISLNNTNSGEQLTIGVGTQQNPNVQQLTFNLAQNSNEQIILNLGNPSTLSTSSSSPTSSTTTSPTGVTGSTSSSGVNVVA
ncbi:MAG TPA: hypothetical protein VIH89_09620 [Candidatus Sulfotelmatobacter sp.]